MKVEIEKCEAYHDERGDLIQFVTASYLDKNGLIFGQIYLLTFSAKNVVRGNHFHHYSSEVFCLISGEVEIVCEDVVTKERIRKTLSVNESMFYKIFIGAGVAHAIRSVSDFAVMVSYSSEEYVGDETDKVGYTLIGK